MDFAALVLFFGMGASPQTPEIFLGIARVFKGLLFAVELASLSLAW